MRSLFYRMRNRTAAFLHDFCWVPVAWFGAHWLRFNFEVIPPLYLQRAWSLLPLVAVVYAVCFIGCGLYRGIWRFASMPDFLRIGKAVVLGSVSGWLLVQVLVFIDMLPSVPVPRSSYVLTGLLLLVFIGAPRFFYRWFKDHHLYYEPGARVLIVGAGQAGEMLLRDLMRDPQAEYQVVALADDDPRKRGIELHGVRIEGATEEIPTIVERCRVDSIFIAMPSASGAAMRRIVSRCEDSGKPFRVVPRLPDLLSGRAGIQELREVSLEDLLGREEVSLEWDSVERRVRGGTVLVSGGGGSIGSELCRQVADLAPRALVIIDRSEFNLYQIERELRRDRPELALYVHLQDTRDADAIDCLLERYRPTIVFHTAAYKHVPMLEAQPVVAIDNNVFGTVALARAADRHGCDVFVLISTDKAVNPTNVMGATKRVAEMFCQNLDARSGTRFVTVRFGNVLGSAGSVVPLFREQITAGGPVTVTHPDIERYFMTIPEASRLILQAAAVGEGGEIFVLDMGDPIRISYLAEQMILLSGKRPGRDIAIVYTGLRPGEKLYEELFHVSEHLQPTPHPKLLLAQTRPVDWEHFLERLGHLYAACRDNDEARVRRDIRELVPEYRPHEESLSAAT